MPTYAYRCTVCDHAFDVQQSFTDDALTVCPQCSGTLRKVFSPVGVVFKGSGFYRNDARSGSKKSSTVGTSAPSTGSGGSGTSGTGTSAGSPTRTPAAPAAGSSTGAGGSGSAKAASA